MTYTELVAAVQSYTENQYSTTDINIFIQNAEQRIYNTDTAYLTYEKM